jgi:hypothetical protein
VHQNALIRVRLLGSPPSDYPLGGEGCPARRGFHLDYQADEVACSTVGAGFSTSKPSSWGPVVLDAAYPLAPFPSCWCFANLPADVTGPAVDAYRARLAAADIDLGPDWGAATAAALAAWIIARGQGLAMVLEEDREWRPGL